MMRVTNQQALEAQYGTPVRLVTYQEWHRAFGAPVRPTTMTLLDGREPLYLGVESLLRRMRLAMWLQAQDRALYLSLHPRA